MSGAFGSVARMIVSFSELVSEGTLVSASLEDAHTHCKARLLLCLWTFCW